MPFIQYGEEIGPLWRSDRTAPGIPVREAAALVCGIGRRSQADWIPLLMEARRHQLITLGVDGRGDGAMKGGEDIIWW